MDAEKFKSDLEAQGIDRAAGDTFIAYIDYQKTDLVTNHTLTSQIALLRSVLRLEMSELRTELKTDMADLRTELKTDMAELRTEIKTDMANLRTEFAEHRLDINRLVLGSSGALGALMIVLRFMPA